ncbi:MAG: amidohydrolase [Pseudomonadota bacterium]|nr:amidohydrolase [Pseudomonadota bacterium]
MVVAPAPALADAGVKSAIKADYDGYLAPLFTHFHQNPELSFLETETARRMAAELKKAGADVTTGYGGTGVVGVMKNGAGPTLLLRADMDGLPMPEKSGLPYASKVMQKGQDGTVYPVMHACGHDTHITALVGTARRLAAMKDRWKGTVLFVVQPAEERVGGAKAMLADGLYTRFPKPDYAVAFHVNSGLATGKISASEGLQYSSADSIDIMVPGIGAHGASAHLGKDPVYIASQIVVALQSIASREIGPLEPGVVTVGAFHAGTKHNIISDRADLQVTVRANNEVTRAQIIAAVDRIAKGVARTHGMPEDKLPVVKVTEGTPTTNNDPVLAKRMNAALARDLGPGAVAPFEQMGMGAEDFAYFVEPKLGVPGYYFAVGGTPQAAFDAEKAGGPAVPSHHSPLFKVAPEPSITLGTEAMVMAALELLKP